MRERERERGLKVRERERDRRMDRERQREMNLAASITTRFMTSIKSALTPFKLPNLSLQSNNAFAICLAF